ncbi:MAG: HEAT repeat domain-containing protein, partial [Candidatus Eremiobacteraeota bacterium]|nr:HEAT repeat domain-containing protein [Candidatus Eremiobacteraeota bacterium]
CVPFAIERISFDPGASVLGDVAYALGADMSAAILQNGEDVVARIRAARELAAEGSATARKALQAALHGDAFWGVSAQVAKALGKTRSAWACELLLTALDHPHPKVRRAVASALGEFREGRVAQALIEKASHDVSYFVCAASWESLGKTRDPRAYDRLRDAVVMRSWNSTVEAGAAAGLGELGDARAGGDLLAAAAAHNDLGLRRAALMALARLAQQVEGQRRRAGDAIAQALDDPSFPVQIAAVDAAKELDDASLLPALDRLRDRAFDGRIRRAAAETALHIRSSAGVTHQMTGLRSDLDALRAEHRKIQEQIEALTQA